jgi:hypothetical protein
MLNAPNVMIGLQILATHILSTIYAHFDLCSMLIDTMLLRWTHQILNKTEGHKNHCKDMPVQQSEQNESCENGVVGEKYKCKKDLSQL